MWGYVGTAALGCPPGAARLSETLPPRTELKEVAALLCDFGRIKPVMESKAQQMH